MKKKWEEKKAMTLEIKKKKILNRKWNIGLIMILQAFPSYVFLVMLNDIPKCSQHFCVECLLGNYDFLVIDLSKFVFHWTKDFAKSLPVTFLSFHVCVQLHGTDVESEHSTPETIRWLCKPGNILSWIFFPLSSKISTLKIVPILSFE